MSFIKTYRKHFTTVGLIWAGCLILFVFAYIIVFAPQRKSKKQVQNQLAETQRMYDSAINATKEETKIRLKEEIENLQAKLKDFVIEFEESANLTFDISQLANEKKVDSFSIKDQENRRGFAGAELEHLRENHINISFEGGFNQFAAFLNALERHRPVVFVDNFRITRSRQEDKGNKVDMKLAVLVRKRQDS